MHRLVLFESLRLQNVIILDLWMSLRTYESLDIRFGKGYTPWNFILANRFHESFNLDYTRMYSTLSNITWLTIHYLKWIRAVKNKTLLLTHRSRHDLRRRLSLNGVGLSDYGRHWSTKAPDYTRSMKLLLLRMFERRDNVDGDWFSSWVGSHSLSRFGWIDNSWVGAYLWGLRFRSFSEELGRGAVHGLLGVFLFLSVEDGFSVSAFAGEFHSLINW